MIKFAVILYKRPEMTPRQFRDYLFNVHTPLAKKIPGLRRCIYNPACADATRKPPAWLCIVEMYFDDFDAMQAAWASPEGRAASEDNASFADLTQTSWSIVEEIEIL